jgi:hypothetical protein
MYPARGTLCIVWLAHGFPRIFFRSAAAPSLYFLMWAETLSVSAAAAVAAQCRAIASCAASSVLNFPTQTVFSTVLRLSVNTAYTVFASMYSLSMNAQSRSSMRIFSAILYSFVVLYSLPRSYSTFLKLKNPFLRDSRCKKSNFTWSCSYS